MHTEPDWHGQLLIQKSAPNVAYRHEGQQSLLIARETINFLRPLRSLGPFLFQDEVLR